MKDPSGDVLPRLVERNPGGPAAEARAAHLIRGSLVPRDPTPAEVERISRAVALRGFPRTRARVILRVALAAGCLVVGAATVRGYEMARKAGWLGAARTAPVTPPPAAPTPKRRGAPKAALLQAPPVVEVPAPALAPAKEDAQERESPSLPTGGVADRPSPKAATLPGIARGRQNPRPAGSRPIATDSPAMLAPPAQIAPPLSPELSGRAPASAPGALVPPPSPVVRASAPAISQEVLELDRAIGYLRRDRNPAAALAALDSYLGRYPHGSMEKEARLARVDALLLLGRNDQALSALEGVTFEPGLRSTELLVVRAELRAARDCQRAEADFGLALGRGPDARLLERILYGRAACRAKVRDLTGAEEDLRRYLERFPAGPHADWARRSLAHQGSSPKRER